ncbi:hypothetical protein DCC85_14385 [Paenibacillus sp. CAA11]|uniref:hypothetical protein n=1 Tax=Paenibacillus sp. CAA11 TaxID=1532905 RepID=UPI000D3A6336|nr:hypothetical protein [Paenibacillus sp. CAA11]AWB45297.1 hypothetical protein DCC85_14385 [Paenibacillus sp. CAA11]
MSRFKRISIIDGPYEFEHGYQEDIGYLVADGMAMYISEGLLWLRAVRKVEGRDSLYLAHEERAGVILANDTGRGDIIIEEMYNRLANMSAFDFLHTDLMSYLQGDFEFHLPTDDAGRANG